MPEIKKIPFDEKYASLDEDLKAKVDELRRYLCSYDVSERVSVKGDLYSAHRKRLAFLTLSRVQAKLSLALDVKDYASSTIPVEENKGSKFADTPLLFRIKSDLSFKRAIQLIDAVMNQNGIEKLATPKEPLPLAFDNKEEAKSPKEEKKPTVSPLKEEKTETVPVINKEEKETVAVLKPASFEMPEIKRTPFPEKFAALDAEMKEKLFAIRSKLAEYELSERISIKGDLFSAHRVRYAFISLGRKVIKLSLNLDVMDYASSSIPVEENKGSKLSDTPLLFRIRSDLSLKRALQLIEDMAEKHGLVRRDTPKELEEIY